MPIITIASSKGGAGKTTIARLLLGHAAQCGHNVAALDADFNHTLRDWAELRSKVKIPVVHSTDETQVVKIIERLQDEHDFVVVDCAGAATQATVFAIGCADLVLTPLQMTDGDVTETVKTMQLVESAAQMMRRPITARVVRTACMPRSLIAGHVQTSAAAAKLTCLHTRLDQLVAFKEMTFDGVVPATGAAGMLVSQLFDEVMELVGEGEEHAPRLAS